MKCMTIACEGGADFQVGAKLWARMTLAHHRTDENAIKMTTGLILCSDCRDKKTKFEDVFGTKAQEILVGKLREADKAEPDFETAEIVFIPINGKPLNPEDVT